MVILPINVFENMLLLCLAHNDKVTLFCFCTLHIIKIPTFQREFICIQLFKNPIADMSNAKNQDKLLNRTKYKETNQNKIRH
jgi:hypothetical protein